jgi:transposase, IS5 family
MKLKVFEPYRINFEEPTWARFPELALIDKILEEHPEIIKAVDADIQIGKKYSKFGRKDSPSVEQLLRVALYKELRGCTYRELEVQMDDSRVFENFTKIPPNSNYSFQVFQKYISRISEDSLKSILQTIIKIAIDAGMEDLERLRIDSTVIETNIHYPTNNSIMWDCIRVAQRELEKLAKIESGLKVINYTKGAKKTYTQINTLRGVSAEKKVELFRKQLKVFTKCINQVKKILKKKVVSIDGMIIHSYLHELLDLMEGVYSMVERWEIHKIKVPNDEKIFSIFERHTDIIVKGQRKVEFGHKVNLATGKSNLVVYCEILNGNPADSTLYEDPIDYVKNQYDVIPQSTAADGAYASLSNIAYSAKQGVKNIVFNKTVGSLESIATSKRMRTILKKWRSGIESVISNLKRGFNIRRCNWKGETRFRAKVLWSVLAYNITRMAEWVIKPLTTA